MESKKQKFKKTFNHKFEDMSDVLFQRFKAGIMQNENKATFSEDEIDGSIKFYTYCHKSNFDLKKFKDAYFEKSKLLKNQLFYAIDKGIEGNKFKIEVFEGNITCYITIKTIPHMNEKLGFLGDETTEDDQSDEAKHMTI